MQEKPSIYQQTLDELYVFFANNGAKKSCAEHVWHGLYKEHTEDLNNINGLEEECKELIINHFTFRSMQQVLRQEAKDGTVKFLFRLADGHIIETVLMRQHFGTSVCVTTQVGCNIGCSFCASGLLRKVRDLTAGEIVEQIIQVQQFLNGKAQRERITHVVVMGIGEPFDNYENVVRFIQIITHPKGLAIAPRRITVSTSGIVPKIYRFADLKPRVNLAISLHAPNNELRTRLMKINRAYPIEKLMAAVDHYLKQTRRRVTFEYIMIKDINDQPEHAHELAMLLKDKKEMVYVNLIPYNPVDEHFHYQRSAKETILNFYDILKKHDIHVVIRQELGSDIDAACGQLRSKHMNTVRRKTINHSQNM